MTANPPVSLVIVSYQRPAHLAIVLKSLEFQRYPNFELIIVSDTEPDTRLPIRWAHFDQANISAARNVGLAMARGQIVAFCDDDAVPEYLWLAHLMQPFADPDIGWAGGFIRGRNGVSFQWKAQMIDRQGGDHAATVEDAPWTRFDPAPDKVLNTIGTNFAIRRDAALDLGGFDAAYRYFLDEADMCMRLAAAGWSGAIVPLAEVHHGFAAGPYRNHHRVPRGLTEIGASLAHFIGKHAPAPLRAQALTRARATQRHRLRGLFDVGLIDGDALNRLMAELDAGLKMTRPAKAPLGPADGGKFVPLPRSGAAPKVIRAPMIGARSAWREAAQLADQGHEVTLLQPRPTHNNLAVRYAPEGFWVHEFGLFGRDADRTARRWRSPSQWAGNEHARVAAMRGLPPLGRDAQP